MAERFEKLYSLQNGLYSADSPVIVSAGALLKDNQTGKTLVQIKYQNVSAQTIKAIKVDIKAYDISGEEIAGVDGYQYLDLNVKSGQSFGGDKAILLPDSVTRSFAITAIKVILADGTNSDVVMPLVTLPEGTGLNSALGNSGLVTQYQLETNKSAKYVPQETMGLWRCTCGQWNSTDICTNCKEKKSSVFTAYDADALSEKLAARLAAEQAEREEKARIAEEKRKEREEQARIDAEAAAKRKKKVTKIMVIVASAAVAIAAVAALAVFVIIPTMKYNAAVQLFEEGKYEEAAATFVALGDYKDASEKAIEMDNNIKYGNAVALFDAGEYLRAVAIFESLGDFEDAKERATEAYEAQYNYAMGQHEAGNYFDAIKAFEALGNYKDAPERLTESYYCIALEMIEECEYDVAYYTLLALGDYKDSQALLNNFKAEYTLVEAKPGGVQITLSYDAQGKLIKEVSKNNNGPQYTREYSYNSNGDLIKMVYTTHAGEKTITEYSYDSSGVLIGRVETYSSGYANTVEYIYGTNGLLIKEVGMDSWGVGSLIEYTYNSNDILIREVYTNTSGTKYTTEYIYDVNGNLVEEFFDFPSHKVTSTSVYSYDSDGNLHTEVYRDSNGSSSTLEYSNYIYFYSPDGWE